jgi:hypothetical protein
MRVRLKGLNCSRKKLANGEITTYWYAWRGGPRLDGEPGTPEFMASYNRAGAELPKEQTGTLDFILDKFQDSDAFLSRALRTQSARREQKARAINPHEHARPRMDCKRLSCLLA